MASRERRRPGFSSVKRQKAPKILHSQGVITRSLKERQKIAEAGQRVGLRFPEPFFWTTDRLDAVATAIPDYGVEALDARPLAVLDPGESRVDFVVDGDSWFNHPFLLDILDWFNAENISFAGS